MERINLNAVARTELGKNAIKRVRQAGLVPGVLYGRNRAPLAVAIERRALLGALDTGAGRNVLIDLRVTRNGKEATDTVMVAEIQRDHLRRQVLHVDLHQISLTEKIEAHVPVILDGIPEGVASGGGILEQHLREVIVRCLPTLIPRHFTVGVAYLHIGGSLHVNDLSVAEGIEIVTASDEVIAAVVAPRIVEAEVPAEGAAAGEPQVIGREPGAAGQTEGRSEPAARAETKGSKAEAAKPGKAEKKE